MSQAFLVKDFRWLDEEEINALDIRSVSEDSVNGYILEVDVGK